MAWFEPTGILSVYHLHTPLSLYWYNLLHLHNPASPPAYPDKNRLLLYCYTQYIQLYNNWDSVLNLIGRKLNVSYPISLIQYIKTTCEKAGIMTHAASGRGICESCSIVHVIVAKSN